MALSSEQETLVLSHVNDDGCHWLWTGSKNRSGGRIMVAGVRMQARRLVWTMFNGEIPEGYMVTPLCGETLCVNPEHLLCGDMLTTQHASDNTFAGKANPYQCPKGHNRKIAFERCKVCNREQAAASRQKDK